MDLTRSCKPSKWPKVAPYFTIGQLCGQFMLLVPSFILDLNIATRLYEPTGSINVEDVSFDRKKNPLKDPFPITGHKWPLEIQLAEAVRVHLRLGSTSRPWLFGYLRSSFVHLD